MDRCMQNMAKHGEEKELESENGWKWSETFAVHHRENSSALAKVMRPGAVFDIRNPRSTEKTVQGPPKSQVKCTICTKLSNKTTRDSIVVSWYPWPPLFLQALSVRFPILSQGMSNIITIFFQHASNIGPVKIHHAGTTFYNMIDNAQNHHNDTTKMKKTVHNKKKRKKQQMRQMNIFPSVLHPHNPWYLVHDQRRLTLAGPSGWQTKWRRCLWEKKRKGKRREREERQRKTISRKRIPKDGRWQRRESVSCRCVVVKCVDRRCADVR